MAKDDNLVEIDLTDEADADAGKKAEEKAKTPPVEAKKEEKKTDATPSADDVVEKLKKDLENERNARAAAEKKASEAHKRVQTTEKEIGTTQLQLVSNAIASIKGESASLKSEYKAALAAQDFDAAADIQEMMADARAKLLQLENGKTAMEEEAKRVPVASSDDPVEQMASRLTAPSAAWVRAHPDYIKNPRLNRKMIRAHEDALDEGITEDTDEYFEYVEKSLGLRKAEPEAEEEKSALSEASAPAQRRASPAAAPVSHSGTASGSRPGRVTLTKEEIEIAEMNGMTPKQYWENKEALKKQGRLN